MYLFGVPYFDKTSYMCVLAERLASLLAAGHRGYAEDVHQWIIYISGAVIRWPGRRVSYSLLRQLMMLIY